MPAITPRKSYVGAYLAGLVAYLQTQTGLDWEKGLTPPEYGDPPAGDVAVKSMTNPADFSRSYFYAEVALLLQWQTDVGSAGKLTMLDWIYEIQEQMEAANITGTYNGIAIANAFSNAEPSAPPEMSQITAATRPDLGLASGVVLYQALLSYRFTVAGRYRDL